MKTYAEPTKRASHFSQSTYAMVLQAEDPRRNILENAAYFFLMLSVVAALVPLADPVGSAVKNSTSRVPIVATTTSL